MEKISCFMNNFEENNRGKPILTSSIIIIIVSLQFFIINFNSAYNYSFYYINMNYSFQFYWMSPE